MNLHDNYKFVLFGDSITRGVIFDETKGRYVISDNNFCNIMKDKVSGEIYNEGKFGSTITRGERKLQTDVMKNNPDIVLVEFGGNDCDFDWDDIAKNPDSEHHPKTELSLFEKSLKKIIGVLKLNNIVPVLMTLPPLDANRYFQWVSKYDENNEKNILTWLGSVDKIYWWHERYNSGIIEVAEETGTNIIDVRGAFLKNEDYRKYLCKDGIHPNLEGHKIIADKILGYMKSNYYYLLKNCMDFQAAN